MHLIGLCLHCPMTSQANACSYCMGFVVLILFRIYLYLQLLCEYPLDDMFPKITMAVSFQNRCEATNQANVKEPSVSRVQLRVFFPPQNLEIEVERPEKNPGYDRTTDYAWITSSASLSVRKKFLGVVDLIKLSSLSVL